MVLRIRPISHAAVILLTTILIILLIGLDSSKSRGQSCSLPPDPCLDATVPLATGPTGSDDAPSCSPIIIDSLGEGFHLTSFQQGVVFDITGTGRPIQVAWTNPRFQNGFLALPAADGLVHNGKELFGNFTAQPRSQHPNGFLALAQFDKKDQGGNEDGVIDNQDAIFAKLRVWIDDNHDGICQPKELHTLSELGILSIGLSYMESRRMDKYGNEFRYRGRLI
jgi:hypothetical protein